MRSVYATGKADLEEGTPAAASSSCCYVTVLLRGIHGVWSIGMGCEGENGDVRFAAAVYVWYGGKGGGLAMEVEAKKLYGSKGGRTGAGESGSWVYSGCAGGCREWLCGLSGFKPAMRCGLRVHL